MSQIQVDNIYNKDATGAPNFPLGANVTGVVTATSFKGSGADLIGVSGFATALSNTQGTLENVCFKTPKEYNVAAGTSVKIESDATSGGIAFTRLNNINLGAGSTVHVGAGTTFVMNVLGVF